MYDGLQMKQNTYLPAVRIPYSVNVKSGMLLKQ